MVKDLYRRLCSTLRGVESGELEADIILRSVFGDDWRVKDLLGKLDFVDGGAEKTALDMAARRLNGEPIQYITGEWEFYGLRFSVGEGVLIPRQDTEVLVETALGLIKDVQSPNIVDLCSGSGCVAAAINFTRPDSKITAVEFSKKAYKYLEKNLEGYIGAVPLFADALKPETAVKFHNLDLITANPPYLTEEDMKALQREVKYEPPEALYGGSDGLEFYRVLPRVWRNSLRPGGSIALEIGALQANDVCRLLEDAGYGDIEIIKDLCGRERVAVGRK